MQVHRRNLCTAGACVSPHPTHLLPCRPDPPPGDGLGESSCVTEVMESIECRLESTSCRSVITSVSSRLSIELSVWTSVGAAVPGPAAASASGSDF